MANEGSIPGSARRNLDLEDLEKVLNCNYSSCSELDISDPAEPVMVRSADQIEMAIPFKVANELHCLKTQIKHVGNTVTYSLHLTFRVLNLIVEYISHRHQVQENTHVDLDYEEEWEKNFIKNVVCRDSVQLREFVLAAENLREESLKAKDYTSVLIKMADLIYLYGPSDTLVDIIQLHTPFSTLSRVQAVFQMLGSRFSF